MILKNFSVFSLASVMMFAACSSDSSSSANSEIDSSSSVSEKESSSSQASESAGPIWEMMQEMPNMDLGERYGAKLWLSAGKNGFYSLWIVDTANSETTYGTVAKKAGISSGELQFSSADGFVFAKGFQPGDSFLKELDKGISLRFSVEDSSLMVSINGEDDFEVGKATRKIDKEYLSRSDSLVGKTLEWNSGDGESVYRFYKNGEYVRIFGNDSNENQFEAGYYDIHRQHLLTTPVHSAGKVLTLGNFALKIGSGEYTFESSDNSETYTVSSMKVSYPDAALLTQNAWEAESNDSLKWTLEMKENSYVIAGKTGLNDNTTKIRRVGDWSVFGDYLVLTVDTCQAAKQVNCYMERGQILQLKESGFEFDNFDTKSEYATPREWTAVEME